MRIDKTICDACAAQITEDRRTLFDVMSFKERKGLGTHLKVNGENKYYDFCDEACLRDFLNKHFPVTQPQPPTP